MEGVRLPMLAITAARVSAAISSGLSVVTNSFPAVCLSVCPLIPGKQGRQFVSNGQVSTKSERVWTFRANTLLYCTRLVDSLFANILIWKSSFCATSSVKKACAPIGHIPRGVPWLTENGQILYDKALSLLSFPGSVASFYPHSCI